MENKLNVVLYKITVYDGVRNTHIVKEFVNPKEKFAVHGYLIDGDLLSVVPGKSLKICNTECIANDQNILFYADEFGHITIRVIPESIEIYEGPDSRGRYGYITRWMTGYRPGHPNGEYGWNERMQVSFGELPKWFYKREGELK